MKNIMSKFTIIFILLFLLNSYLFSQEKVGTTSFQFLKVMPDARATAMGETGTAFVTNSTALFINPAGIGMMSGFDAAATYVDWFLDMSISSFAAAYQLSYLGTIGLQAMYTSVGEIQETTVDRLGFVGDTYNPGLTGNTFSPSSMVLGLSYARMLTEKFSFGVTGKYVHQDLYLEKASQMLFDFGLIYRTGFRSLQLGAVVRHFGPDIKFVEEAFPSPQTFSIAVSSNLLAPESALFMETGDQKIMVAMEMVQPRDFAQQYNVGLEYSLKDMVFLRGGYKINYDQEGLTLGAGINVSRFVIDYSFNDYGEYLDAVHRFTFRFTGID